MSTVLCLVSTVHLISDVMKSQVVRLALVVWLVGLVGPAAALHCNVCVSQVVLVVLVMMEVMEAILLVTAGRSGRFLCQQQHTGGDRLRQWVLQDRVQQGNCGAPHTQLLLR